MHNTNAEKKASVSFFFFPKPQSFRFYLLENFASNTIEFRRTIQSPNETNSYHANYKNFFATNASPDARNGYATNKICRLPLKSLSCKRKTLHLNNNDVSLRYYSWITWEIYWQSLFTIAPIRLYDLNSKGWIAPCMYVASDVLFKWLLKRICFFQAVRDSLIKWKRVFVSSHTTSSGN